MNDTCSHSLLLCSAHYWLMGTWKKCRLFFREFSLQNSPQVFFGSEAFQIKRCSKTTPLYLFVYFRKMCFNEEKNVSLFFFKVSFLKCCSIFFLHFQWFIHKVSSFWQITSYIYKPILESSAKIYHISSSNIVILHTFFGKHFFLIRLVVFISQQFYLSTILFLIWLVFKSSWVKSIGVSVQFKIPSKLSKVNLFVTWCVLQLIEKVTDSEKVYVIA